ncbi:DUF881 domain-containing protein [Rhodococcus triatomae]|uniref:Uncharacterized conserved protein YlxW, UPF0749 family n=1 Tax=Rhodococcus triatomae TaxID=300028 RepID=A0A1G8SJ26_9NOCA|nr:DUF881 domain-containing protein [Rhodococcus triatomae]QNG18710.1 DUF881 domain-containing protein [Rhodococcus triatomae]QNG25379.1 DUF881 domain-containing protein [Rhodococcus triatomae]SDJ29246.1 Uncharacterized conserved protein YlxW, UPF0749 family [Rhodococcus triatomae]
MSSEGKHELHTDSSGSRRSHAVFAIIAALLLGGLGVAIATQVKTTGSGDALDSASPADLLVVLDTVNQREAALRQQVSGLEQTLNELQQGGGPQAALDQARARLTSLSIQIGTVPAAGPGISMTVTDPSSGVGPDVILDLLQELRAAGAEAIEIRGDDGAALRVGVDSWVAGAAGRLEVDGQVLTSPYGVVAIGDPPTLAAALNIPGGVVDHVSRSGGRITIEQSGQLTVAALREIEPRQYAQPGN